MKKHIALDCYSYGIVGDDDVTMPHTNARNGAMLVQICATLVRTQLSCFKWIVECFQAPRLPLH